MKSSATSSEICRTRSVQKKTVPFRTQRAIMSSPAKSVLIWRPISPTRSSIWARVINVVCAICARIIASGETVSVSEIGALHARYVRLSDRFKSCWTYHQFAAGVYKNFLEEEVPYKVDFAKTYEQIKAVAGTLNASQTLAANGAIATCDVALDRAAAHLLYADQRIGPSAL